MPGHIVVIAGTYPVTIKELVKAVEFCTVACQLCSKRSYNDCKYQKICLFLASEMFVDATSSRSLASRTKVKDTCMRQDDQKLIPQHC